MATNSILFFKFFFIKKLFEHAVKIGRPILTQKLKKLKSRKIKGPPSHRHEITKKCAQIRDKTKITL